MRKKLVLPAMTLFALASLLAATGPHPDFSGTWTMDPAHSESAHQDVPMESSTMIIRASDGGIMIETTRKDTGAPTTFHEILNFKLDGTETTNTGDGGVTVTGKARWDGRKLVLETVRNLNDSTVTTVYVHTLNPTGRTLTVDKTLTVQHGYMGRSAPTTGHGVDVFVKAN